MLKHIFQRFKYSGIIRYFVFSGISSDETIAPGLNGGKYDIYLQKLVFEATMRAKVIYLERLGFFPLMKMFKEDFPYPWSYFRRKFPNFL